MRAAVDNADIRAKMMTILSSRMSPKRVEAVRHRLSTLEDMPNLPQDFMPAEVLYLAEEYRKQFPDAAKSVGPVSRELAELATHAPADVDPDRISIDFGVSHPTLAHTNSRELLNLQPFPVSGGATSRLFGESLESSNLYWARLADELGYMPVMLNRLVPELTRHMVGEIFATNIEDWPAIQRAMRSTGDAFRENKIQALHRSDGAALNQGAGQPGRSEEKQ